MPLYLYEDLVQVPRVTETTLSTLQSPSVFRPELDTPKSDRFIGNGDAALSQKILDLAKAQAKSLVQPDRVADDFGRKSISAARTWIIWTASSHRWTSSECCILALGRKEGEAGFQQVQCLQGGRLGSLCESNFK